MENASISTNAPRKNVKRDMNASTEWVLTTVLMLMNVAAAFTIAMSDLFASIPKARSDAKT